jgi:hypothetical protein
MLIVNFRQDGDSNWNDFLVYDSIASFSHFMVSIIINFIDYHEQVVLYTHY